MKKIETLILALAIMLAGLAVADELRAQDSLAKVNARWVEAGTTPSTMADVLHANGVNGVAPHPGLWHCGTAGNFRYCPCYPLPYATWTDPETFNLGLFRYDFSPMKQPQACPGGGGPAPCLYAVNGGPNHSLTWLEPGYSERPIAGQPFVPNFYPGPAGLCDVWTGAGNTGACPDPNYVNRIRGNPIWTAGYNYKKPAMDADPGCQPNPVTPTPAATPRPTVTPAPTPPPGPSIYADWIYEAVAEHYLVGCAPNLFCPGDPAVMAQGLVTRAQLTVFMLKAAKGPSHVPSKCQAPGAFTDVPCQ